MVYNNAMALKKFSKVQLIRKVLRDSTQAQKNQMLKLVLARMSKAGLIRLCVAIGRKNIGKLKKLTTSKGMNRKTARPKAFEKKRKVKAKTKTKTKRKLRAGVYIKNINGVMRKFRVMPNGQWRFMKMAKKRGQ